MRGAPALRWILAFVVSAFAATPSAAIEFWDGRVQIHGFYETRMSFQWEDFSGSSDIDMGQWLHVLNIEIEAEIAPDGWGPFDMVGAFARVEVKYDCAWRHACTLSDSVNVWGDNPDGRLPQRLSSGRKTNSIGAGQNALGDTRRYAQEDILNLAFDNNNRIQPSGSRVKVPLHSSPTWTAQSNAGTGPDGIRGTYDDPGDDVSFAVFGPVQGDDGDDCLFGSRKVKTNSAAGFVSQTLPINPGCNIEANGSLRHVPNPFDSRNTNLATGALGGGVLPLRPRPEFAAGENATKGASQGLFIPSARLRQALQDGEFDSIDQNFTVNELQWNRGASQQQTKELKEAYVEFEALDYQLYVRAGKQTIVWGKTELFRNQDQWNPVDIGVGPLSSLEESRIGVWSVKGIWSFYSVGPLEDVRLEVAAIYDNFEPGDIPRCGESTTPSVACNLTYGYMVHGITGAGIAGAIKPPNAWNSWKGIEVGARLEFRWDRFSFAFTDYYGFSDSAYADLLYAYSRNVDPISGRPRRTNLTGNCRRGNEDACLTSRNAITDHSVNQQLFHQICATTVGVAAGAGDAASCFQNLWNSQVVANPALDASIAQIFGTILSGTGSGATPFNGATIGDSFGGFNATTRIALGRFPNAFQNGSLFELTTSPFGICSPFNPNCPFASLPSPFVPLTIDGNEIGPPAAGGFSTGGNLFTVPGVYAGTLSEHITVEQAALLGCGPFYGTDCDNDGVDIMNAEASFLFQSLPWFEGTEGNPDWNTTDASRAQPGTVGFDGGPACTRYDRMTGEVFVLPGCRGPGEAGYDPRVDGSPGTAVHPFTGQAFKSEGAVISWNAMMLWTILGAIPTGEPNADRDTFNPDLPFREDGCSLAKPQLCAAISGFSGVTTVTRPSVRAGGNGRYGRRQFVWSAAPEFVLRYEKRNVMGFSMDFAEDVTKTNWGVEFTWQEGLPFGDSNSFDGISEGDTYNLTISVDRPTFINFMNANRTFFFNSQLFVSYIGDYTQGFTTPGPWTFLWLLNANTGYFQDRLLVSAVMVYDFQTNSGAFLPSATYRFTENFSATVGASVLAGRWDPITLGVGIQAAASERQQGTRSFAENGISPVRDLDSFFFRLRYTF